METKFPPPAAPSSLSRAAGVEPRGDPRAPLGPAPLGSGSGYKKRGGVCRTKAPRRLGSCRTDPPPLCILSGPRAAPGSPAPEGRRPGTRSSSGPSRRRDPDKETRLQRGAWPHGSGVAGKYPGPAGRRAAHPPAARAAGARHAIPAVATPGRRRSRSPGPGPARLGLQTHRLRRARLCPGSRRGSAATRGCVGLRVRAVGAGGARLAKSARGTGSVAHRPRVPVSHRETEGASSRGGGRGRMPRHPPPPRPPAPAGAAESRSPPERHAGTKPSCPPQGQVSPRAADPGGSGRVPRENGRTGRRAPRLRHPGRHALFPQPGCPRPPAPSTDPPRAMQGERGDARETEAPRGAASRKFGCPRVPAESPGRGQGVLSSRVPYGPSPGHQPGWLRIQNPEPKFSLWVPGLPRPEGFFCGGQRGRESRGEGGLGFRVTCVGRAGTPHWRLQLEAPTSLQVQPERGRPGPAQRGQDCERRLAPRPLGPPHPAHARDTPVPGAATRTRAAAGQGRGKEAPGRPSPQRPPAAPFGF